ncbi:MAG: hypothetical protein M1570_00860 [Chloroflexi bacterium]|nr:hypothetical protein [Chloroflexota bacterium]
MAPRKPRIKEDVVRSREKPVDLNIVIDETDDEANCLSVLRRARRILGNDATPEAISRWIEEHPNGE